MGKIFYSYAIGRDKEIPGTQARSTTIPEELGRINYLMSDKTGTLTMNQMIFKKLHLGTVGYTDDTFDEVVSSVAAEYRDGKVPSSRTRTRVTEAGLRLAARTMTELTVTAPQGTTLGYDILQVFPFTSESKRMGIIVRDKSSGEILFYMKGADVVMSTIVQYNDWLMEEVDNMAREGLRTLVVAKKILTEEQYVDFEQRYQAAKLSVVNRSAQVAAVVESLQRDMKLLCVP